MSWIRGNSKETMMAELKADYLLNDGWWRWWWREGRLQRLGGNENYEQNSRKGRKGGRRSGMKRSSTHTHTHLRCSNPKTRPRFSRGVKSWLGAYFKHDSFQLEGEDGLEPGMSKHVCRFSLLLTVSVHARYSRYLSIYVVVFLKGPKQNGSTLELIDNAKKPTRSPLLNYRTFLCKSAEWIPPNIDITGAFCLIKMA